MNDLAFLKVTDGEDGRYVAVDQHWFPELNLSTWHWWVNEKGRVQVLANSGRYKGQALVRVINKTPEGFDTDHINGDPRDCTERNLRTANRSQNMANRGKPETGHNSSDLKGVHYSKWHSNPWRAQVCFNYKRIALGSYKTEQEASFAYDVAAFLCFGSFAKLNNISIIDSNRKSFIEYKVRSIIRDKVFNGGKLPDELSPHESGGQQPQPQK